MCAHVGASCAQEVLIDIGEEAGVSPAQVAATLTAAATECMADAAVQGASAGFLGQAAGAAEEQQEAEDEVKEQPAVRGGLLTRSLVDFSPLLSFAKAGKRHCWSSLCMHASGGWSIGPGYLIAVPIGF